MLRPPLNRANHTEYYRNPNPSRYPVPYPAMGQRGHNLPRCRKECAADANSLGERHEALTNPQPQAAMPATDLNGGPRWPS